jgi:hypothetical protein
MKKTPHQILLDQHMAEVLKGFLIIPECRFYQPRKWRVDVVAIRYLEPAKHCERKLAVEIEGATWTSGRHTRGSGWERDCEKYNQLAVEGFGLLRFTPKQVLRGEDLPILRAWRDARS